MYRVKTRDPFPETSVDIPSILFSTLSIAPEHPPQVIVTCRIQSASISNTLYHVLDRLRLDVVGNLTLTLNLYLCSDILAKFPDALLSFPKSVSAKGEDMRSVSLRLEFWIGNRVWG